MFDLTNVTALVCGATGFLGNAIASAVTNAGAHVIIQGRNLEKLNKTADSIKSQVGKKPLAVVNSVDSYEQAQRLINDSARTLRRPVNIVINCIGSACDKPFVFHNNRDIRQTFGANLFPIVNISQAAVEHYLRHGGGNIINFSSITGQVGQPMRSLYGSTKGAVIAYSKSTARKYAKSNIRINCIAPQVVTGGLADDMNPKIKAMLQATTPIARECQVDDLIGPTLMLANERSGFITGEVVNVTGGLVTW